MDELMIPTLTWTDHWDVYLAAIYGVLLVEKIAYETTKNLKEWWLDRWDDLFIEIPLALMMVRDLNVIWYWQDMSFNWSNTWTGISCGLVSMAGPVALYEILPYLIHELKKRVLRTFGASDKTIEGMSNNKKSE